MRILYSHYLTSDDHPAVRMVQAIANELREQGHIVEVHRSSPAEPTGTGGPAKRPSWLKRNMWFLRELGRNRGSLKADTQAISKFQPDVILCRQDAYRFSMALAARRSNTPLITYADAPVAYESRHFNAAHRWHPPGVVEQVEKWGLHQSRAVITVSSPAKRLLEKYRLQVPVIVASNGVDTTRFQPRTLEQKEATRAAWKIETPLVAGFVGSFRSFHGIPLLRELIQRTANRSDLTWLLVGDGPERAALAEACQGMPRVRFTGRQAPDVVPELLGSIDVLVSPHQHQVAEFYFCPLKILEAMAAGVTCLASDQGDNQLILGNGGRCLKSDTPAEWLSSLEQLLDSDQLRAECSEVGRRRAVESYTWAETAKRVDQAIREAVSNSSSVVNGNQGVAHAF
jgi:glycosyltransferase involved in cell wall biosynthesis